MGRAAPAWAALRCAAWLRGDSLFSSLPGQEAKAAGMKGSSGGSELVLLVLLGRAAGLMLAQAL